MKERTASWILLAVAFFWGGGFIGTRICLNSGMPPYKMLFLRFLGATILIWILFRKKIKRIPGKTWIIGIIYGVVSALSYVLDTQAMLLIDTNKACFLESTATFWFMVMICFYFKVVPTGYSWLMGICTIAGSLLIGGSDVSAIQGGFGRGEIIALLCAIVCGLSVFLSTTIGRGHQTAPITVIQMGSCALIMFIMHLTEGKGGYVHPSGYAGLLYLIAFPTTFCFLMRNECVKHVPSVKGSLILTTETLFCAVMSVVILHEKMPLKSIIGAALIFIAIIIDTLHPLVPPELENKKAGVVKQEVN